MSIDLVSNGIFCLRIEFDLMMLNGSPIKLQTPYLYLDYRNKGE